MFVETLWNAIQFTDSPFVFVSVLLIGGISFLVFVYRLVNVPFIRAEFRQNQRTEPLWKWVVLYWLDIPITAVKVYYDLIRLILAGIITVAMVIIYILRRLVQVTNPKDNISSYLFWLIEMENSAGEILGNERAVHQQQIIQLNRQVAASRTMAGTYRQATQSIVEIIKLAQRGGHFNVQWATQQATGIFNDAIRKAEAAERQLNQMKVNNNQATPNKKNSGDYVSYTNGNVKGNGKQQKQQKQPKQPKQQQGGYPPAPQYPVNGQDWNNQGYPQQQAPYGQQPYPQTPQYPQQQPFQQMPYGQQPYPQQQMPYGQQPNGQPMSKNQMKKMAKQQQQQGYQGQNDPRMNPAQYKPDGYVPLNINVPAYDAPVSNWGYDDNLNTGYQSFNPPYNQGYPQSEPSFGAGYNNPAAWQQEEPIPIQLPEWGIPPQPVWNPEPEQRNRRPSIFRK